MRLDHYCRFSVIPRDWHLEWVRGLQCSSKTKGSTRKLIIRPPQAKCIRTDRHTDSQKQGNHWQSGETQKVGKTRLYERREQRREIEIFERKKREFKGLREQMANCTRVSQPGSKSVLCIRTGVGGGDGGGGGVGGRRREGAMEEAGRCDQALRACHWATLVRGRASMSFQCFTSAGPLFHDR